MRMGLIAKQENSQMTKLHVSCKTRKLQMTSYGSHAKASKLQVTSYGSHELQVTRYGSHAKASKLPVTKYGSQSKASELPVTNYGSHAKPSKLQMTSYRSHAKPSKLQVTSYGCYVNYEMWLLACHLTLIVIHAMSHSWIGWVYASSVKKLSSMPRFIVGLGEPMYQVWNCSSQWVFSDHGWGLPLHPGPTGKKLKPYCVPMSLKNQIRLAAYTESISDPSLRHGDHGIDHGDQGLSAKLTKGVQSLVK